MNLSDAELRRWYRQYNRRWFADELPDDIDVLYAPVDGLCGEVSEGEAGDLIVRINPAYALDTRIARITLLHEMAHIKLWPKRNHGTVFQRELQRLAIAGAYKGLL